MPEFKDRNPPVLDDIIEPGLAEKAKPDDDAQPSLWDDEALSAEGSRDDPGTGGTGPRADSFLYDTREIEVTPDVSTLEDDFDIPPRVHADAHAEPRPDEETARPDPAPSVAPGDSGSVEAAVDRAERPEAYRPAVDEAPAARLSEPHAPGQARSDAASVPDWPPVTSGEPEGPDAAVEHGAERVTHDRVADAEAQEPAVAPADARELDALTNRLVRTLMPEIELILRKRIREILDQTSSGSSSGYDPE